MCSLQVARGCSSLGVRLLDAVRPFGLLRAIPIHSNRVRVLNNNLLVLTVGTQGKASGFQDALAESLGSCLATFADSLQPSRLCDIPGHSPFRVNEALGQRRIDIECTVGCCGSLARAAWVCDTDKGTASACS